MEIHQILPNIVKGDAIGNETLLIRDILKEWGFKSEIYAQHIQPGIDAFPYLRYKQVSSKKNILIYHYSIGSDISDFIMELSDKIILIYHNLTPEKYFWGVNDHIASLLRKGRDDLKKISKKVILALGDSEYNRQELQELGYLNTGVFPLVINFEKYSRINEEILKHYEDHWINLLFVGRIAPNKRQDDIIKIFYYYKFTNPNSRLFLIGQYQGFERYYRKLNDIIEQLSLPDIIILDNVSDEDLNAYYSIADVFICMSEHEGFCIPLVESMFFGVPIIANNATAIPQTLGDSGILVNKEDYCIIAEIINEIIENKKLRDQIVKKEKMRLRAFERPVVEDLFKKYIEMVTN